jgi:serine/threonine protein kinase
MPPEVCLGKPYDHKADVWAVGVILYEMIMLKKPFDAETINGVLSQITQCVYEPVSEDVDPNLKMLVVALLNKDFNKRPSIIEVANVPCVKKEILDFIEENDIENEVLDILDWI